ncbi:hypothetical protein [Burkholderia mayonis]|uniref:hypothetical protein n=1 Tax=Burkholderia mayonis TaxID=1385591 RepID=UPI00131ED3B3|nr:hypothetical protein [Burkholderia mayonis]
MSPKLPPRDASRSLRFVCDTPLTMKTIRGESLFYSEVRTSFLQDCKTSGECGMCKRNPIPLRKVADGGWRLARDVNLVIPKPTDDAWRGPVSPREHAAHTANPAPPA